MNIREVEFFAKQIEPKVLEPKIMEEKTQEQKKVLSPKGVLEDLFILLEDYAPAWYTEEHHRRALAVLLEREP